MIWLYCMYAIIFFFLGEISICYILYGIIKIQMSIMHSGIRGYSLKLTCHCADPSNIL